MKKNIISIVVVILILILMVFLFPTFIKFMEYKRPYIFIGKDSVVTYHKCRAGNGETFYYRDNKIYNTGDTIK